jgi:transposase
VNVIGIDVAQKEHWVQEARGRYRLENEKSAIKAWMKGVPKDTIIALEATGGHGQLLADLAFKRGLKVFILSPRQVRGYRVSLGRRAKTDKLDCGLIREFVESNHQHLHAYRPWDEPWKTARRLLRLRCGLADDRARIATRMKALGASARDIASVTRGIKAHMRKLERQIHELMKDDPGYKALQTINGIGPLTAAATTAVMRQIPLKSSDAFIAYMGYDMKVEDSGKSKGVRKISHWGDRRLRALYYNCANSAGSTQTWREYKQRMLDKGLKPVQANCALARKLARTAFHVFTTQESFGT